MLFYHGSRDAAFNPKVPHLITLMTSNTMYFDPRDFEVFSKDQKGWRPGRILLNDRPIDEDKNMFEVGTIAGKVVRAVKGKQKRRSTGPGSTEGRKARA